MEVHIYTDGAYSPLLNQGGIGIVYTIDNKVVKTYSKMYKDTTNNRMELQAVISALASIKGKIDKLYINSDSQYVIGTVTLGWQRKKNTDLWETYDKIYRRARTFCNTIIFNHVKGHADNTFNNQADKLAVSASKELA